MKNLEITTKINSQNKREEKSIRILNQTFLYSDKRGFSKNANINYDFAIKIIETFPVEMGKGSYLSEPKPVLMLDRLDKASQIIRVSWGMRKDGHVLTIHQGNTHVWTSKPIE